VRRGNALPAGLVLAGAVSVQTGAGIANRLFAQLPPASVTTLRLWAGALVLVIVAGRPTARALADVRRRGAWQDAAITAAFGVTLGFMNFAIYQAFARIPLGIAVTIEFLGPLTVTVTAALAGSATARSRALALGCAGLAALGVVLLANGVAGHLNWAGVAWAVGAAFAWAFYIIGSKATGQRMPGSSGLVIAMCVAAIAVTIPGVVQGGSRMFRPDLLAIGAAIGVLSSVIPYWLEMEALRRISTQLFGVWMSLQPAVAALIGLALLSQRLSPAEWLGICCVVTASAAASRTPKRSEALDTSATVRRSATRKPGAPPTLTEAMGAGAIAPRRSAHRVVVSGRDAPESAPSPVPWTVPETPTGHIQAAGAAEPGTAEPSPPTTSAVNGALRWCACFPV
jgi:inner membrane transporter RhtA